MVLGHGSECGEMRGTELRIGTRKHQAIVLDLLKTINSKRTSWKRLEKLFVVRSHFVLPVARIGRPDIVWSVNQTDTSSHETDENL